VTGGAVRIFALALLAACALLGGRAGAADRTLGAGVPKPAASGAPWTPEATSRLDADLDALLAGAPTLRGAHVGLLVVDTRSGSVLYARNADDAFMPASTFKLLAGSAALALLGPAFRFHTDAVLDSSTGTLYVRGGGDPLLRAADLDAMAQTVRAAGVTALRAVRVDATAFEPAPYPPGWEWDDFPFSYAPALSAATVEENVVHLTVTPGVSAGAPATVRSAPPPFDRPAPVPSAGCPLTRAFLLRVAATTAAKDGADTVDVDRDAGGCVAVTGTLPIGSAPEELDAAVPSPVRYVREIAERALAAAGVAVDPFAPPAGGVAAVDGAAAAPPAARVVWSHDGEPLADVLADMWWPSDNLVAELLLKAIGRHDRGLPGSSDGGAAAERVWLKSIGVDPATLTIADGSGLSTYDRVTPRALAALLQYDWNSLNRGLVLDDLAIAGVRGTLAHSFRGSLAEGRTFAKDGVVNHTRGLAGYLATLHHGALTFAWSVDDWMGTDADLAALRARVLSRLIGD
jgi:D-alanyl-D-alanine carboxypeptidase/D-alanyl-D-alanine-endopeptidase (penicillin-binding protein 4)